MKSQIIIAWSITWRSLVRSMFYGLPFNLLAHFLPRDYWLLTLLLTFCSWIIYFLTFIIAIKVTFRKHKSHVIKIVENPDTSYRFEKQLFGTLLSIIIILAVLVKIGIIPLASESQLREKFNHRHMKNKVAENVLKGMKQSSQEREQYKKGYNEAVSLGEAGKYQEAIQIIKTIEALAVTTGERAKNLQRLKSLIEEKMQESN